MCRQARLALAAPGVRDPEDVAVVGLLADDVDDVGLEGAQVRKGGFLV